LTKLSLFAALALVAAAAPPVLAKDHDVRADDGRASSDRSPDDRTQDDRSQGDDAGGSARLKAAFGNTIQSTYPDGRQAELWLNPDGSYTAEGRRHDRSSGHWKLSGEKICLKQSHPFAFGMSYCTPIAHVRIGSSWTGKAVTGEAIRIRLVRGRVDPAEG
jgi:hypothetical protein